MEAIKIIPEKIPGSQLLKKDSPCIDDKAFCDVHGHYQKYFKGFNGALREYQFCPQCRDNEIADKKRKEEESARRIKIEAFHRQSGVPKRFKGMDINAIDINYHKLPEDNLKLKETVETVKGYLNTYPERLKKGASGFFCGECGTGKTMLACIMVEDIINQGHSAHYITAWQMIQEIRKGYHKTVDESISYFIKEYIEKSFLVIDEVGVQHGTDDERILLYQVIDGRYNEVKPTVIISNSKNPVEDGYLDVRTIDRLKEGGGFSITFNGDSYRK